MSDARCEEIMGFLRTQGFESGCHPASQAAENEFYVSKRFCDGDRRGEVEYGYELTEYDSHTNTWSNPTTPLLCLWSGLGDAASYAFRLKNPSMATVAALLAVAGDTTLTYKG